MILLVSQALDDGERAEVQQLISDGVAALRVGLGESEALEDVLRREREWSRGKHEAEGRDQDKGTFHGFPSLK